MLSPSEVQQGDAAAEDRNPTEATSLGESIARDERKGEAFLGEGTSSAITIKQVASPGDRSGSAKNSGLRTVQVTGPIGIIKAIPEQLCALWKSQGRCKSAFVRASC